MKITKRGATHCPICGDTDILAVNDLLICNACGHQWPKPVREPDQPTFKEAGLEDDQPGLFSGAPDDTKRES